MNAKKIKTRQYQPTQNIDKINKNNNNEFLKYITKANQRKKN